MTSSEPTLAGLPSGVRVPVQLLDLKAQYATIRAEVEAAMWAFAERVRLCESSGRKYGFGRGCGPE